MPPESNPPQVEEQFDEELDFYESPQKAEQQPSATAYRQLPAPETLDLQTRLSEIARQISQTLDSIDAQIEQHAIGLRLLQPALSGKLDIRWWRLRGDGHRTPVLVKWELDNRRPGRMQPRQIQRVSRRVVSSNGLFALNHETVLNLALAVDRLIKDRALLKDSFRYQILPAATKAKRIAAHVDWLKIQCEKGIAQGLSNLALDGNEWRLPDTYASRIDQEKIVQLAAQMEEQKRRGA